MSSATKLYLGLDGGGTKTAAAILDQNGTELGRGFGGPCNIATCDDATLRQSVSDARAAALRAAGLPEATAFAGVCAGVAGYTAKTRRADFARLLAETAPGDRHRVEPDFVIAYWGATEGRPGIVVSAGTGAVVYGRNTEGKTARADGRGWLLGDNGGGFHLGRYALANLYGPGGTEKPLTEVGRRVLEYLEVPDTDAVIEWLYRDFSPRKVAAVGGQVLCWAEDGLEEAREMVDYSATNLSWSVREVFEALNATPKTLRLYLLGSMWKSAFYVHCFRTRIATFMRSDSYRGRRPLVLKPRSDAAYGAAFLASCAEGA
jgi:N-acetylglucosamine kinase-like BadF-type ATPase